MCKQELRALEEERRRILERIMGLSSFEGFDAEKWEELKRLVYEPLPLNVDVISPCHSTWT